MKYSGAILAVIVGSVLVTVLRGRFPEADSAFLAFIDQNLVSVFATLSAFFAYCSYLLWRHQKSASNDRKPDHS